MSARGMRCSALGLAPILWWRIPGSSYLLVRCSEFRSDGTRRAQASATTCELQPMALISALDVRFVLRTLQSRPGYCFVVVATLAPGIGATTAPVSLTDPRH